MEAFFQDLRFGLRMLARHPGFAAVAVLTLAVGIGANTAVFSVAYGVLLKPLPYQDPDRLVRIYEHHLRAPKFPIAPGNFSDYRAESRSLEAMALYVRGDLQLAEGDRPEHLAGMQVTAGFFQLLGWQPTLGREFRAEDEVMGDHRVVILSHALWQRRFAGDPNIIGRAVKFSGESFTVVGVLPPGFQHVGGAYRSHDHGGGVDVWRPLVLGPNQMPRNQHFLNGVGRLAAGATRAQAEQEMQAIAARLAERYPATNSDWTLRLFPLTDEIVGTVRPTMLVLLGAVGFVLLIACVNVASLLLARATARTKEIAVRAALGAGRGRIVRQMLAESLLLAVLGGAAGLLLAFWGVDALVAFGPAKLPRLHMVGMDANILAFTGGLALLTALLFGLIPAAQMSRGDLTAALKEGGRVGHVGARSQRLRRGLVAAQVAMACVLLTGAGLLLRSFVRLNAQDPGFRPENVLTLGLSLPPARYGKAEQLTAFHRRLLERVAALPGVQSVGSSSDLPWTGYDENSGFAIVGREFPPGQGPAARYHRRSPGYFEALGVPPRAGRHLTPADADKAPEVILINESLARRYWDTAEGAVGARVRLWGAERTVAGVVGDIKDKPADAGARPAFYFPFDQMPQGDLLLAVRADGDPLNLAEPIRRAVLELDPELPVTDVRLLDDIAGVAVNGPRFTMLLVGVFAGAALFLAAVGIYGVMSQSVSQRTHEIGIRMALGAGRRDVLRLVVGQGMAVALIGVAAGLTAAFALTRLMAGLLYGVSAVDPATFAGAAVLLVATAFAACYVPARRATKVDPMLALRNE